MSRQCILRCLLNSHLPINLNHNAENIIGRSKLTKIKDQACSRQQIWLKADCENCSVEIKQLGVNPSGLDGFALKRNESYTVGHGSRLEVLLNNYVHIIEFDPPPEDYIENKVCRKRKLEPDYSNMQSSKQMKTDTNSHFSSSEAHRDMWEEIDKGELYIFTSKGVKSSNKIAAFDMDGTLIKTKSGKVHPVDTNDWQIAFPTVEQKLKEKFMEGFKIVILSNQAPIGNGRVKIDDFKKKIESLVKKLSVPIQVYIATGKGIYRKPLNGMWKFLTEKRNDSITIDTLHSFYCGDAAGRAPNWAPGKKKDHSLVDKLMAENIGVRFFTPEQFFLGHSITNVPMIKPEFCPKEIVPVPFDEKLLSTTKEILVLVGFPGSGKSFLATQIEQKTGHRYVAVCRDVIGTWQKCVAEAKLLLQSGKSVIVDSTNPDVESRGRWIALSKEMNVDCRCAKLAVTKAHAQHNNKFRELMKINHVPVNDIVFHTYKNKYTDPTSREGFKEVLEVKFGANFEDKASEELYKMYLLEK
ncbi:uncharacterized protein F21D5.5 [Amyelois transitella]|uniref:uncharacterized protein F21D5.5 n=1 Tax=Amyelois transitella TaxID=680683 RepID=UPI00067AB28E|nr:uncharacterized protein F21D5.5 [Amyelois transitella]